jgi:hypothetical protein
LDLSTRATNFFCSKDDMEFVSVSISSQEGYNLWQVWFIHYNGEVIVDNDMLKSCLDEGKTLRQALINLNDWLDSWFTVPYFLEQDRSDIVESIGYGD